jgi:predicted RNA binding protein YcfA (HicA-like mRNA interferase family)
MTKLPVVSGKDAVKALMKIGYDVDHQRGSHIVLRQNTSPFRRVTIPNHKEISKGTLRAIIRETGLTIQEFSELL